jgi:hypothetical protein
MNDAEIALIGVGFYRLSDEKRHRILKNAESLMFYQKTGQQSSTDMQNPNGIKKEN